ncbi:MAG: glycosyltransferase family 2 protein [bacterium]
MIERKREKVAAIVVTYNRKQLLAECLDALLNQSYPLDAIFLIDNASTDGTAEYLREKGFIDKTLPTRPMEEAQSTVYKINYIRMHENTGGAGGFYEGVRVSSARGYDWLWLMDDDAEPKENCLENLLSGIHSLPKAAAAAPLNVDVEGNIQKLHRGYLRKDRWQMVPLSEQVYANNERFIEIGYGSFVGLLISNKAVEKAGLPDKDFFIYCDDVEYCCRLAEYGAIFLDKHAVIVHKDRVEKETGIANTESIEQLWKMYYGTRNKLLCYKKYRENKSFLLFELGYSFARSVVKISIFDNHKLTRLKLLALAYAHISLNKKGKKICPSAWIKKFKKEKQ